MSLVQHAFEMQPRTDKYDLGYIHTFYAHLFEARKDTVRQMLEIGIYRGHSIRLWQSYFPNAQVHASDIQRCPTVEKLERVSVYYENAYNLSFVEKFQPESFDIVIDDGPHTYESMVYFLTHYPALVKSGGVLVLEDIIDPKWTPSLVALLDPAVWEVSVQDMRNKQLNPVLLDRWKNGLDVIVALKK
jgi:hypothetical protein